MKLTVPQIIAKMGLLPVRLTEDWEHLEYNKLGAPPDGDVTATLIDGGTIYALRSVWGDRTQLGALHEAIHLMMGKLSFEDEGEGLMAVEWALAQYLKPELYTMWRQMFSEYGMDWTPEREDPEDPVDQETEVGSDDAFLESPEWKEMVKCAVNQGFLAKDGSVVWGLGVHPSCREV